MKTREDKMVKLEFFSKLPFLKEKNQHIHFLVHGHSSLSTFGLNLVRGPKVLQISIFLNQTMGKSHLPWSDFMVHGVNQPSIRQVFKRDWTMCSKSTNLSRLNSQHN